jgi:hypothetical protein
MGILRLNREGAKDAKGVFGWFVLILEEGSESEQTNPFGQKYVHQRCSWGLGVLIFEPREGPQYRLSELPR